MSEKTNETNAVKAKKPIYKKWWFWIIIGIIVLAIIGGVAGGTSEGANTDRDDNNVTVGKIGDTIKNSDGVSICLVSCENTKILGTEYLNDTTENNYILLTIQVTNNSKKTQTFYGSCADLYNSNNTKYEAQTSLYIDYIISEDIGVGISKTFQVVFETPTTTEQEKYTVKIGYSMYTGDWNRVVFDLSK